MRRTLHCSFSQTHIRVHTHLDLHTHIRAISYNICIHKHVQPFMVQAEWRKSFFYIFPSMIPLTI